MQILVDYREARAKLGALLSAAEEGNRVVIRRPGSRDVVLLPASELEALRAEARELLRRAAGHRD